MVKEAIFFSMGSPPGFSFVPILPYPGPGRNQDRFFVPQSQTGRRGRERQQNAPAGLREAAGADDKPESAILNDAAMPRHIFFSAALISVCSL